jgi:hypothetical protein
MTFGDTGSGSGFFFITADVHFLDRSAFAREGHWLVATSVRTEGTTHLQYLLNRSRILVDVCCLPILRKQLN